MKIKLLKLRLSYFFMQRKQFYGKDLSENMPDLVKPESNGTDSIIEDILRWADDGGQMLPAYSQGTPGSGTGKRMINEGKEDNDGS